MTKEKLDRQMNGQSLTTPLPKMKYLAHSGGASYLYQGRPIGLNVSPATWQLYMNVILENVQINR